MEGSEFAGGMIKKWHCGYPPRSWSREVSETQGGVKMRVIMRFSGNLLNRLITALKCSQFPRVRWLSNSKATIESSAWHPETVPGASWVFFLFLLFCPPFSFLFSSLFYVFYFLFLTRGTLGTTMYLVSAGCTSRDKAQLAVPGD